MVDRLELARQFVQEQVQKRCDLVGAFVVGSVARGDATAASDIDLGLIVAGSEGEELQRAGVDAWRDGVYIEAALAPEERYASFERAMESPFSATHMNDALIPYNPTGVFTRVQQQVRAAFMEPKWLGTRVHSHLQSMREAASGLHESVAAQDVLAICGHAGSLFFFLVSIPLIRIGITPSSTRALVQLDQISPELKGRICDCEGSSRMNPGDVASLLSIASEGIPLTAAAWGLLPEYFVQKSGWMAARGLYREAVHLVWGMVSGIAWKSLQAEDPTVRSTAQGIAERWLRAVGWKGQEVLKGKLRVADGLLVKMEALGADLPSPETGGTT